MANTNNPYGWMFQGNLAGGNACITKRYVTKSNLTLAPGDPVNLTAGRLTLAGSTSVGVFGVCVESVTGVAATRKSALIIVAMRDYLWAAQVKSTVNITAGLLGKKYAVGGTTSGKMGLRTTAGTSVCNIVGLLPIPGNAYGTYAQLLFTIGKSTYQTT
jgi:hypothetical protein